METIEEQSKCGEYRKRWPEGRGRSKYPANISFFNVARRVVAKGVERGETTFGAKRSS